MSTVICDVVKCPYNKTGFCDKVAIAIVTTPAGPVCKQWVNHNRIIDVDWAMSHNQAARTNIQTLETEECIDDLEEMDTNNENNSEIE